MEKGGGGYKWENNPPSLQQYLLYFVFVLLTSYVVLLYISIYMKQVYVRTCAMKTNAAIAVTKLIPLVTAGDVDEQGSM